MGLGDAQSAEELFGQSEAPAVPCPGCAASRRLLLLAGVLGLSAGLSIAWLIASFTHDG